MFVTMSHFEQFMPPDLVGPNQKYWRAVTLSLETPWYLLVYVAEYEGHKVPQTTLVAWESTLLDIVAGIPEADRRGIARVDKERSPGSRWSVSWIERLWAPAPDEVEEGGIVLLQLAGDPQVRDEHLTPVASREGRALVFSAPPAEQNAEGDAQGQARAQGDTDVTHPHQKDGHEERTEVPVDFPSPVPAGAVPGAHAKVGVREAAGAFTNDSTAEREERYSICLDLLDQLVAYAEHKRVEKPHLAADKLITQVLAQLHKKRFGWGLSPAEADWISARVRAHFFGRHE